MCRIVVFNCKGGVGKTTTALNLGAAIARSGEKVRLLDLDPQAHLSRLLSALPNEAANSAFSLYTISTSLVSLERPVPPIGHIVPAHGNLMKADSLFGKGPAVLNRLRNVIEAADAEERKTTLVDCCPFLGVLSLSAIFAAELVLIPVSADFLSAQGAHQIAHALNALQPVLKRRIPRRYLLTRFDRRRKMCGEVYDGLARTYPGEVCNTIIHESAAIASSPLEGKDIFRYQPKNVGAIEYEALFNELKAASLI